MDTFETLIQELKRSPAAKRDQILQEKKTGCICPQCPTYTSCSVKEQERLFCLIGQSFQCISFDQGCICDTCKIFRDSGFTHKKFCLLGDEKGQRYMESWVTA